MRFNSRLRIVSAVLIAPIFLHAQAGPPLPVQWSAVEQIPAGARLRVHLNSGKEVKGAVRGVSPASLNVSTGAGTVELARAEITRVYRFVPRSKGRAAAVGGGIGGGIGLGMGAWMYSQGDFVKSVIPAAALFGAGIGAGISLLFALRSKAVLIYAAHPDGDLR